MSGRNSQVSRIYAVLDILEQAPQGLSVLEIWERLTDRGHEIGKRSVYRDLDALNQAGFPVFPSGDDGVKSRWKLERAARVTGYLMLSARELLALYLARASLTPLSSTPFFKDLEAIFDKIEDKLGGKQKGFLDELADEVHYQPGPKWGLGLDPDVLETVRACCSEQQELAVEYDSANSGQKRVRRLGPHYLYFAKGSIYLIAEDLEDKEVKVFGLPRMKNAEMLDRPYKAKVLDPGEFFQHSIGVFRGKDPIAVKICFSKKVAPFVRERGWHPSQQVVSKSDGTLEMKIEVTETPELVQWILGFGPDAEVLEPKGLRKRVAGEAQATADLYNE